MSTKVIQLWRFGSNLNKRWYFGFTYGVLPNDIWEQRYHPKYPWWKRWRITVGDLFPKAKTRLDPLAGRGLDLMGKVTPR